MTEKLRNNGHLGPALLLLGTLMTPVKDSLFSPEESEVDAAIQQLDPETKDTTSVVDQVESDVKNKTIKALDGQKKDEQYQDEQAQNTAEEKFWVLATEINDILETQESPLVLNSDPGGFAEFTFEDSILHFRAALPNASEIDKTKKYTIVVQVYDSVQDEHGTTTVTLLHQKHLTADTPEKMATLLSRCFDEHYAEGYE